MDLLDSSCHRSIRDHCYLTSEGEVDYSAFTHQLSELFSSNVYLLRRDGCLLGKAKRSEIGYDPYAQFLLRGFLSVRFTQQLLSVTKTYTSEQRDGLFLHLEWKNFFTIGHSLIIPLFLDGHWGVLIFYRLKPFTEDEVTRGKFAANVFRLSMCVEQEE